MWHGSTATIAVCFRGQNDAPMIHLPWQCNGEKPHPCARTGPTNPDKLASSALCVLAWASVAPNEHTPCDIPAVWLRWSALFLGKCGDLSLFDSAVDPHYIEDRPSYLVQKRGSNLFTSRGSCSHGGIAFQSSLVYSFFTFFDCYLNATSDRNLMYVGCLIMQEIFSSYGKYRKNFQI